MISWIADLIWSTTSRFFGALLTTVETWRSALITRWRLLVPVFVVLVGFAILSLATAESGSRLEVSGILAIAVLATLLAILVRGGYVAAFLGALLIAALAAPSFLVIGVLGIATGPGAAHRRTTLPRDCGKRSTGRRLDRLASAEESLERRRERVPHAQHDIR